RTVDGGKPSRLPFLHTAVRRWQQGRRSVRMAPPSHPPSSFGATTIMVTVSIGLENCLESPPKVLREARFGLLLNQASVNKDFAYASTLLARRFPGKLAALFAPQHGFWSEQQENMIETGHGRDESLGVPLYSLYSETRKPTPAMLKGLEC